MDRNFFADCARCVRRASVAVFVTTALLGRGLSFESAGGPGFAFAEGAQPNAKEEIANLMLCYARGTDAIGDSTTNLNPKQAGVAIYRDCFTDDAVFSVWFPGTPFTNQVFPDSAMTSPSASLTGPENWADFVNGVFRTNGYTFTQHIISNIRVDIQGTAAKLISYLNASHVIQRGTPRVVECIAVANGTYSLQVQKTNQGWRIKSLDLTLITFNPSFEAGTGCSGGN